MNLSSYINQTITTSSGSGSLLRQSVPTIINGIMSGGSVVSVAVTASSVVSSSVSATSIATPSLTASSVSAISLSSPAVTANTISISGGTINSASISGCSVSGSTINNPTITNYVETIYTPSASSAFTVDLANGTIQKLTTNNNVTITLPSSVAGKSYMIIVAYGGTHTVTWAGGGTIKWSGGSAPTATSVNGKFDIYCFTCDGTNTFGRSGGSNF